jgi:catechol 2,3-dioxygenase-like lactoylglutathione lyase family enzyme
MESTTGALQLDHFILGVADLEEAARELGAALGRRPSWRGRHPAYGTANVLFRLDNAYLELLAPDTERGSEVDAWAGSLGRFLNARGGGLFSMALSTPDVAATVADVRARGLTVEDPAEADGHDLDTGAVRRWSNARVPPELTHGTRFFYIQHLSPRETLPVAPLRTDESGAATGVLGVEVESADADKARAMWRDIVGLKESEAHDGWSYDLGNAALLVHAGVGEAETPDRWQSLILRTPSVTALADRLDRERVPFEQGDFGVISGVRVRAAGAEIVLTESL